MAVPDIPQVLEIPSVPAVSNNIHESTITLSDTLINDQLIADQDCQMDSVYRTNVFD